MTFSPDGALLATCNTGSATEPVHLWDVATGASLARWPHAGGAQAVAFAPDGQLLAACGHQGVVVWDVLARQEIARFTGHLAAVKCIGWAPDGQVLASGAGDGAVMLWDVTGRWVDGRLPPARLDAKAMEQLWKALASPDAVAAHAARWKLAAADGVVDYLAQRLRPVERIEAERLKKLLTDLDAADFAVRERATQQLAGLGQATAPALKKAFTADASAEAADRARQLLQRLAGDAALSERRRGLRAVAILASQGGASQGGASQGGASRGGPRARQVLDVLAQGAPEAELTQAERAALARLERR
ncbi:MAG: hypothetical protein L0Y71_23360 [Gemmataceae bacterium]|nr:hypothetical protein [Gemmataceae bacterium]